MSKERPQPDDIFGFTEAERMHDWISHRRILGLIGDEHTAVHNVEVSSNNYGEFLFVTMSRPTEKARTFLTFFGLGFHEQRERWLTDEWRWYKTQRWTDQIPQKLSAEDAKALIQSRIDEITPYMKPQEQSRRARFFEMIADLTDDDAATTEFEDMGIWDDDDLDDLR